MPLRKTTPPRGVLKSAPADSERIHHGRYHASADLGRYVEHFWSVRWNLEGVAPQRVETLPHPSVHMLFERGPGGQIAGVSHGKFTRLLEGDSGVFAVKFTPGGFYPFADVAISTFTERVVGLVDVFGANGQTLEQQVLAAVTDAERIALVETFLRRRLAEADEIDENVAKVSGMVYAVADDRSILTVEDLGNRYGVNTRTLQRLFARYVGVSPKWVIQRYRLHEAAKQLSHGTIAQSALALSLGYSDQAHFVRDFKAVVGMSPASYSKGVG